MKINANLFDCAKYLINNNYVDTGFGCVYVKTNDPNDWYIQDGVKYTGMKIESYKNFITLHNVIPNSSPTDMLHITDNKIYRTGWDNISSEHIGDGAIKMLEDYINKYKNIVIFISVINDDLSKYVNEITKELNLNLIRQTHIGAIGNIPAATHYIFESTDAAQVINFINKICAYN